MDRDEKARMRNYIGEQFDAGLVPTDGTCAATLS